MYLMEFSCQSSVCAELCAEGAGLRDADAKMRTVGKMR